RPAAAARAGGQPGRPPRRARRSGGCRARVARRRGRREAAGAGRPRDPGGAAGHRAVSGPPPRGRVILVGAGPGDPDLVTLRGAARRRGADVLVHASLVPRELLELAPPRAERIDVGKRGHDAPTRIQEEISALLVERAAAGKTVVRLKGGDPFVYGRGGEEASACRRAGIPFEVVPGVTTALAVPAFAGIPVTDRRHAASLA